MTVTKQGRGVCERVAGVDVIVAITIGAMAGLTIACAQPPVTPSGDTTVTTPALLAPANGAQIANLKQPVTLTINNAFVTDSSAAVLYTFEVATDAAFATKVQTPTASPGNGQTSVVLPTLPAGQNYFWHARATGGSTVGVFSATRSFTVGAALALVDPDPGGAFDRSLAERLADVHGDQCGSDRPDCRGDLPV